MNTLGIRMFAAAIATATSLVAAPMARADVIFQYEAPCIFTCSNAGLATGQLVTATIGISDAAVVPGGFLTLSDVASFALSAGALSFGLADLTVFLVQLDAAADAATAFAIFGASATGGFLLFDDGATTNFFSLGPTADLQAVGGPGTFGLVIPEPASLLLVIAAMTALFGLRRQKRQ
jgi:hypothetical protein